MAGHIGLVRVYADELTDVAIIAALKAGQFYASDGTLANCPDITDISLDSMSITVSVAASGLFEWIGSSGRVLRSHVDTEDTYKIRGNEDYVRLRFTDSSSGKHAFLNPIIVR